MRKFILQIKQYHWHWVLLRLAVMWPFFILHTVGEWAFTAGVWLIDKLPDPRKED